GGMAWADSGGDGVQTEKPAREAPSRQRLQRRVQPPVKLDLVVQGGKHRRYGITRLRRRYRNGKLRQISEVECRLYRCRCPHADAVLNKRGSKANRDPRTSKVGSNGNHADRSSDVPPTKLLRSNSDFTESTDECE